MAKNVFGTAVIKFWDKSIEVDAVGIPVHVKTDILRWEHIISNDRLLMQTFELHSIVVRLSVKKERKHLTWV